MGERQEKHDAQGATTALKCAAKEETCEGPLCSSYQHEAKLFIIHCRSGLLRGVDFPLRLHRGDAVAIARQNAHVLNPARSCTVAPILAGFDYKVRIPANSLL